jgi:hypothetical protein
MCGRYILFAKLITLEVIYLFVYTYGGKMNPYRILVGNPEGKRPLGRPRHRWENTMDLREIGLGGMDWIDLAQYRDQWRAHVITVINLRVPYNVGKFWRSGATRILKKDSAPRSYLVCY